jgi:hypothetical protein
MSTETKTMSEPEVQEVVKPWYSLDSLKNTFGLSSDPNKKVTDAKIALDKAKFDLEAAQREAAPPGDVVAAPPGDVAAAQVEPIIGGRRRTRRSRRSKKTKRRRSKRSKKTKRTKKSKRTRR